MKFEIKNRWSGEVIFTAEIDCSDDAPRSIKIGLAVRAAVKERANLRSTDLSSADLSFIDLSSTDLSFANLRSTDLRSADLSFADLSFIDLSSTDLSFANLRSTDLSSADLSFADLSFADLSFANLRSTDLSFANLRFADLSFANLSFANLSSANLSSADLSSTDLAGSKGSELAVAKTRILPEGSLIVWKACDSQVIVKMRVPEEARRSHAWGRKCRAEFVDVLEVFGADEGVGMHDPRVIYRPGERVACHKWNEDWQEECTGGIHFFLTREEAEEWGR